MELIHELNRAFDLQRVAIRALGWEENASPGIGSEAQDVINQQILAEYDILIAIFGRTIGSPTKASQSGTIEEIEHAIAHSNKEMGTYRVQVYFLDRLEGLSSGAVAELKKVADYRDSLAEKGVFYRTFSDDDQLEREVRTNLHRAISDYLSKNALPRPENASKATSESAPLQPAERTSFHSAVATEEYGFLDYLEQSETAMHDMTVSVEAIANLLGEIGAETTRRTLEVEKVSSPLVPTTDKKRVINSFADFLKEKAGEMKQRATAAKVAIGIYSTSMAMVVDLQKEAQDKEAYQAELASFLLQAENLLQAMTQSRASISELIKVTEGLPRITIQFNQAKRLLLDACRESLDVVDRTEQAVFAITARG